MSRNPVMPGERAFLEAVRVFAPVIGYGNMMEIVSHAWFLDLEKKYGQGAAAFTVGPIVGALPDKAREKYIERVRSDELFKEKGEENGTKEST